jgi:hypothetical protein
MQESPARKNECNKLAKFSTAAPSAAPRLFDRPVGRLKKYSPRCIFLLHAGADLVFFKSQLASFRNKQRAASTTASVA